MHKVYLNQNLMRTIARATIFKLTRGRPRHSGTTENDRNRSQMARVYVILVIVNEQERGRPHSLVGLGRRWHGSWAFDTTYDFIFMREGVNDTRLQAFGFYE